MRDYLRKKRTMLLLLGLLLVLLLASSTLLGCATDPTTRWAQAREGLTSTTNVAIVAAESGQLNDTEILAVDAVIQGARKALDAAETYLPDGGSAFQNWLDIAYAGLSKLDERMNDDGDGPDDATDGD